MRLNRMTSDGKRVLPKCNGTKIKSQRTSKRPPIKTNYPVTTEMLEGEGDIFLNNNNVNFSTISLVWRAPNSLK
jgi:hypothetical protein